MVICYFRKLPTFFQARNLAHEENTYYYDFKADQYFRKDAVAYNFYKCMKCFCMASGCFSYRYKRVWIKWAAQYYVRAIKNGGKTK